MQALSNKQKRHLKSAAHHLQAVVQLGEKGLFEGLIVEIKRALSDHELIKVKFVGHKEEREELSQQIAKQTDSVLVGIIGNHCILYRMQPDESRRRIALPADEAPE